MKQGTINKFGFGFENKQPHQEPPQKPKPIQYQIEVKEDSFGCTIDFDNDVFTSTNVKMELVQKNKSNKILLDLPLNDFIDIVNALTDKKLQPSVTIFFPFNLFTQNLQLNKDKYLLITFSMLDNNYINHTLLKTRNYVDFPIEIEGKTFINQEFAEIDSKNFTYLYCNFLKEVESIYNNKNLDNNFTKRKTFYDSFYLENYKNYLINTYHSEVFKLTASSRKGGFNPLIVYLIK